MTYFVSIQANLYREGPFGLTFIAMYNILSKNQTEYFVSDINSYLTKKVK